jgi:transketolase
VRPADANETAQAWRVAVDTDGPVGLVLTRQDVPVLEGTAGNEGVLKGAYVLVDTDGDPELVLIGTGSEVHLCVQAYEQLTAEGEKVRLVSMPSWELFDLQPKEYRAEILPPNVRARVSVEQASTLGWERFVGTDGAMIGMHTFGASAPLKDVQRKFGFTPDAVVAACKGQLAEARVGAR